MRIIVEQIKTSVDVTDDEIFGIAKARIKKSRAFKFSGEQYIYKRSIDARHNDNIKFVSSVCFDVEPKNNLPSPEELLRHGIKYLANDDIVMSTVKEAPQYPPLVR